jgi:hypothetical protein
MSPQLITAILVPEPVRVSESAPAATAPVRCTPAETAPRATAPAHAARQKVLQCNSRAAMQHKAAIRAGQEPHAGPTPVSSAGSVDVPHDRPWVGFQTCLAHVPSFLFLLRWNQPPHSSSSLAPSSLPASSVRASSAGLAASSPSRGASSAALGLPPSRGASSRSARPLSSSPSARSLSFSRVSSSESRPRRRPPRLRLRLRLRLRERLEAEGSARHMVGLVNTDFFELSMRNASSTKPIIARQERASAKRNRAAEAHGALGEGRRRRGEDGSAQTRARGGTRTRSGRGRQAARAGGKAQQGEGKEHEAANSGETRGGTHRKHRAGLTRHAQKTQGWPDTARTENTGLA